MRTDTLSHAFGAGTRDIARAPSQPSVAARLFNALIKAQERRARHVVTAHLAKNDDATLARLGWSQSQIEALRRAPASAVGTL